MQQRRAALDGRDLAPLDDTGRYQHRKVRSTGFMHRFDCRRIGIIRQPTRAPVVQQGACLRAFRGRIALAQGGVGPVM